MSITTARRLILATAMVLLALTLPTCITAEEHDTVTYDAGKDEFQMLMIMQDIHVKDADDLGYLQAIYNNRDHLITPAIPGGANVIGMFSYSFLRLSDTQFLALNLYGSRPTEIEAVTTQVPLADVQIHPGTFFVQNNKVGYYQSITVPGKIIDAALLEVSKTLQTDDMSKGMQDELDRRTAGGKTLTWAQVTAEALKQIEIKPDAPETPATGPATTPATATAPAADDVQPQYAFEADSLKNLKQAITDKTLRITRDKQKLLLTLPVTAKDAAGMANLYKVALARFEEVVKTTKETPEIAEKLQDARTALRVATALTVTAADNGISVSVDLLTLASAVDAPPTKPVNLNSKDDALKDGTEVLKYLVEQKIDVSNTITPDQIKADFLAGKLKAFPSPKPLKPGDGIVAPKAQ